MSNNQDGQDLASSSIPKTINIQQSNRDKPFIKISGTPNTYLRLTLPKKQERTRSWLAWFLSGTFCITIFAGLFIIYKVTISTAEFDEEKLQHINQSILSLLSVQTGIVSN